MNLLIISLTIRDHERKYLLQSIKKKIHPLFTREKQLYFEIRKKTQLLSQVISTNRNNQIQEFKKRASYFEDYMTTNYVLHEEFKRKSTISQGLITQTCKLSDSCLLILAHKMISMKSLLIFIPHKIKMKKKRLREEGKLQKGFEK